MKLRTIAAAVLSLLLLAPPAQAGSVWRQDFNTPGGLPSNLIPYTGGTFHPSESISVHGGVMDFWLYNRQNPAVPGGWESARSAVVAAENGGYLNFRYGEIQWRMLVQDDSGGLVGWNVVGLLWPETDRPEDGEVDIVEWHPGFDMMTYFHDVGVRHAYNCQIFKITGAPGPLRAWHTYGIRWSSYGYSFWVDGQRYFDTTCGQPHARMHFVIQIGADPGKTGVAPGNSFGHVYIDWMQVAL